MEDDWLSKRESGADFDVSSEATWQKNYQDVSLCDNSFPEEGRVAIDNPKGGKTACPFW
jgi:hypothetical protein